MSATARSGTHQSPRLAATRSSEAGLSGCATSGKDADRTADFRVGRKRCVMILNLRPTAAPTFRANDTGGAAVPLAGQFGKVGAARKARIRGATTGERLRNLRREAGVSQERLASASGLRSMTISCIERDIQMPTEQTIDALASSLGIERRRFADFILAGVPLDQGADSTSRRRDAWFRVTDHSWSPIVRPGDTVGVDIRSEPDGGADLVVATIRLPDGRTADVLGMTSGDGTGIRSAMFGEPLDAHVVAARPVSWIRRRTR